MTRQLLLDTHAYIWALSAPDRLSTAARTALRPSGVPVLVSAATTWEMAIKHRSGRWPQVEVLLHQHEQMLDRLGARALDITAADGLRAGGLSWSHADPFDRMLAAQALTTGATLISRDAAFAELPGLSLLW